MQTTVVLGGTGFLGAHVVAAAFSRSQHSATFADPDGPPVVGVGREPDKAPRFCDPRDGARWHAADLAPPGAAAALLDELSPALVLNCAALSRVDSCAADHELARRLNTEVPAEVAEWCAAHAARLVTVSTDLVFGGRPTPAKGLTEEDPIAPLSFYGESKAAGEQAVLSAHPRALVARLPLLYGNSGGRGRGASDSLLEAVAADRRPPLFEDEWRTPLEVTNAAQALVELLHGETHGILHVAGPERVSRLELGLAVLQAMGLEEQNARDSVRGARREEAGGAEERPADVSLDSTRARGILGTELLGVRAGTQRAVR